MNAKFIGVKFLHTVKLNTVLDLWKILTVITLILLRQYV